MGPKSQKEYAASIKNRLLSSPGPLEEPGLIEAPFYLSITQIYSQKNLLQFPNRDTAVYGFHFDLGTAVIYLALYLLGINIP